VLHLFADHLLPVFLAAGIGWLLAALARIDPRPLARVAFYALSPALVYQAIVDNRLSAGDLGRMLAFTIATLVVLGAAAALAARRFGWPRSMTAAATLVVLLPNAGNFGLSVNLFAFGQEGFAEAAVYFVGAAVLSHTVGVLIASLGRATVKDAIKGLVRVPAIWAVTAAFASVNVHVTLPGPADQAMRLLAAACIPVFLLVLGMQLHGARWRGRLGPLALAVGLRLGGGIAIALPAALLLGLEGPARQAAILQSGMPSAVICIILASQYEVEPGFVTSAVFVSTVLSPLTLTPLLAYLGAR
jgi:malate permease and related proteins